MSQNPTLFGSFNARNLAPEQIAQSFVPPAHFAKLIGQHHSLVLGPRGSGKTTLLKMLQPEALDAWSAPESADMRALINYKSVYIATDTSWGKQVGAVSSRTPTAYDRLGIASFTTHILRRLVGVMHYLSTHHQEYELSAERERQVAADIAATYALEGTFVSLLAIKYEMGRRLSRIYQLGGRNDIAVASESASLDLAFLPCCVNAIDVYADAVGRQTERWAFLFDELELAPQAIRDYLLTSLRSVDERLLFKLSLVPSGPDVKGFGEALSAQAGQDFEVVPLWYSHKDDGEAFCRRLWASMMTARGSSATPEEVLGASVFAVDAAAWREKGTAYTTDSPVHRRARSLASKDRTFVEYLDKHGIKLEELEGLSGKRRAKTLRKASSIIALRNEFLETGTTTGGTLRTRKVPTVYTGADAVFAITEGNPRWFRGIVGALVDAKADNQLEIGPSQQAQQIEKAVNRFRALLRTIPSPAWGPKRTHRGLLTILDQLGQYFSDRLLRDPFTVDPPGTFTVDSRTNDALLECLGEALNAGALVTMESMEDLGASLRGKRLRLAYLLAPHYRISLRLERDVSLSTALGEAGRTEDSTLFAM